MCKYGSRYGVEVTHPIPEDSVFVREFQSGNYGELCLVIESESFPLLGSGDLIPEIERPMFNAIIPKHVEEEE